MRDGPTVSRSVEPSRPAQPGIPPTPAERRALRDAISRWARGRDLPTGPAALDRLEGWARDALQQGGFDESYLRLGMVLVSNEIHLPRLAEIPADRRLLLLPRCLRHADRCTAETDELGLLCRRCGLCSLGEITRRAEQLGYVTVISEGTAVVTALIASGQVEAVVGVSCLDMLEKIFPYVRAAGVPAVAVPLLYDGCVDTAFDLDWLDDLLATRAEPAEDPDAWDLAQMAREVRTWFEPAALAGLFDQPDDPTAAVAIDWLASAGKRWRPTLAACAYRALTGRGDDDAIRQAAVAVECFHKASLIHDDIEDDDDQRYGRPTVHKAHGLPIALNAGDLLLGEGYRLLARCPADPARRAEMLAAAAEGHRRLCLGQGAELHWTAHPRPLTVEEVREIFARKTAPAFEVALRVGALLGGADQGTCRHLADYSLHLGIAYQIRDDLADFVDPPREEISHASALGAQPPGRVDGEQGKPTRPAGASPPPAGADGTSDLHAMRPSILLALACQRASGAELGMLQAVCSGQVRSADVADRLQAELDRLAVADAARQMLVHHADQAAAALDHLACENLARPLRTVIARIFHDVDGLCCG